MSGPARWTIAIACLLFAAATAALPFLLPSAGIRPLGLALVVGFLLLIVIACFAGPLQAVAGRVIAMSIFASCVAYLAIEIREPLPHLVPFLKTYRRSAANIVNAILAFFTFGLPAGYFALKGRLPANAPLGEPLQDEDEEEGRPLRP